MQFAEIRALWEKWEGGEAHLNGVEGKLLYLLQYPAGNQRLAFRKTALTAAINLTFASMKMS